MIRGLRTSLKNTVRGSLFRLGYEVHSVPRYVRGSCHEAVQPLATFAPWNADQEFVETYAAIRAHTLVDKYRCHELWTLVEQSGKLCGSLIEIGVWRGGTAALIAHRARLCGISAPVYLCDTFRGVVKTGPEDSLYRGGEHADTSRPIIESLLLSRFQLGNTRILEGVFPDETAHHVADETFRFCHIDVDSYQSANDILAWIWDRMVVGGIVVYDDYGFAACDGISKHVDQQRLSPDRLVLHNLNGHAVIIKIR